MPAGQERSASASPEPTNVVDAKTTKEFFIYMLVKDIELGPSVVDLIDNSVDAARGRENRQDLTGFWAKVSFNDSTFQIADNCGGMTSKVAHERAFYFGRPPGQKPDPGTIGLFGIGMKRSIFKIGTVSVVESTTSDEHFAVRISVRDWLKEPDSWTFPFEQLPPPAADVTKGVVVRVETLNDAVSKDFRQAMFETRLIEMIEARLAVPISQGFRVYVNDNEVNQTTIGIESSNLIAPAAWIAPIPAEGGTVVSTQLVAGLGKSDPGSAGWYIYCNGRLVVGPEQTRITGWGREFPQMHPQYARFRGFATFQSDDARALPWNTTKTAVDEDSSVFRTAREHIIQLTLPVKNFLDKLAIETASPEEEKPLRAAADTAPILPLSSISAPQEFKAPAARLAAKLKPEGPDLGVITYYVLRRKILRAKKALKVGTQPEVGLATFEYFYKRECEEE